MDNEEKIKNELEEIGKKLTIITKSLEDTEVRIGKIESYLYNDSDTDSDGIVKTVRKHNERIKTLEDKEKVKDAKMSVWGMIGGALIMVLIEIIRYFFSHNK